MAPADQDDASAFDCWAWHADAVRVFRAMRRQWVTKMSPTGSLLYECLRLEALPVVERGLGVRMRGERFEQLQVLEEAALELLRAE